jgi:multisubunit Na+/H+ antiporter MnhB subunit
MPLELGNKVWTTIAWAAEGIALVWLSLSRRIPQLRICSYAVFVLVAVRLIFFDSTAPQDFQPFLNERFLAFAVSIVAMYLAAYLLWRERDALWEWERHAWSIYPIFLIAATVFLTLVIPLELGNKVWTTIAWAAEGIALVWLSLDRRIPLFRICSYAVFVLVAVRLIFFDTTVDLRTFQPVVNERFLAFVVSIAIMYLAAYLLWRERSVLPQWEKTAWSVYPIFLVAANFFSLWLLSFEVCCLGCLCCDPVGCGHL